MHIGALFRFKTSKAGRLEKSLGQLFCGQQLFIKVSFGRVQVGQPIVKILCLRNGCTNRSFQTTVYRPMDRFEFLRNAALPPQFRRSPTASMTWFVWRGVKSPRRPCLTHS